MRTEFRVAMGTGILVLVSCVWARGAQQSAPPPPPPAVAQPKPGSMTAATPAKSGAASSIASVVSPDAAAASPAAATRKAWKCLKDGLAEKNYDRRAQVIAALGTIGLRRDAVSLVEGGQTTRTPLFGRLLSMFSGL